MQTSLETELFSMDMPDATFTDTESAASVSAMREACHHTLYTVVNSRAYQEDDGSLLVLWQKMLIALDVVTVIVLAAAEIYMIRKYKRQRTV